MKTFACSIAACKAVTIEIVDGKVGGVNAPYVHTVCFFDAESDAEAQAMALLLAKNRWPEEEGWRNHSFETLEVVSA